MRRELKKREEVKIVDGMSLKKNIYGVRREEGEINSNGQQENTDTLRETRSGGENGREKTTKWFYTQLSNKVSSSFFSFFLYFVFFMVC